MTRRMVPVLLLAALSCGRDATSGPRRFESAQGRYVVILETTPSPIPLNQPFEARIRVEPRAAPSGPLAVEVDARMPEHFHGMNRVARTTRQPDGTFKTEGLLFHMPGRWELYVDIAEGARTERAQVEVILE
ncbi:MAG TPA: hypothetical protein VF950_29640 [Planctomycetota bacterium]